MTKHSILKRFLAVLGLVNLCTFWLLSKEEFFSLFLGSSAFAVSYLNLYKRVSQLIFPIKTSRLNERPGFFGVLFKIVLRFAQFVMPAVLIFVGIRHFNHPFWVATGLFLGLTVGVISLFFEMRNISARSSEDA